MMAVADVFFVILVVIGVGVIACDAIGCTTIGVDPGIIIIVVVGISEVIVIAVVVGIVVDSVVDGSISRFCHFSSPNPNPNPNPRTNPSNSLQILSHIESEHTRTNDKKPLSGHLVVNWWVDEEEGK